MKYMKHFPMIRLVEWLGGNEVRVFFSLGKKTIPVEMKLPWVRSAKQARVVDEGMGLDPGDGLDISGLDLWTMPHKVIRLVEARSAKRGSKKRGSRRAAA